MREPLRIQPTFGERPPIVGNLTKKQVSLLRHAVPVRMQLDIGDGWIECSDLLRMHQGDQSPVKKVLPIQPQSARESSKPPVLVFC